MNIMFEDSVTEDVRSKYILLELDTFYFSSIDKQKTSYCLIEAIPLQEMLSLNKFLDLHKNLIKNYGLRNWKFCKDALEHLIGKWNGEVDSFYNEMDARIKTYKDPGPGIEWTCIITRI